MRRVFFLAGSLAAFSLAYLCVCASVADPQEGALSAIQGSTAKVAKAAQVPASEDEEYQEPPLMMKAYDLGDLLLEVPSPAKRVDDLGNGRTVDDTNPPFALPLAYSYSGSHPPYEMEKEIVGSIAAAKRDAYTQLTEVISSVVSPTDWYAVGGSSTLTVLGDLLLVRTTAENHKKITALLNLIRHRAATRKTLSVEVHWLWLSEEELHRLTPSTAENANNQPTGNLLVDDAAWASVAQERAKEDSDVRSGYHAILTCLSGQTNVATAGRQSRFIVSMIPVVGDEKTAPSGDFAPTPIIAPSCPVSPPAVPASPAVSFPPSSGMSGYQPTTTTIQEGPAIEVRPVLCEKNEVLLDVRSRVIEVQTQASGGEAQANWPATNLQANVVRELAAAIDRPQVSTHRIDATLRAPLGRRVLAGGMTYGTEPENGDRSLYVFVKVALCEPLDATPKAKAKRQ